jgi:hypothetical protein
VVVEAVLRNVMERDSTLTLGEYLSVMTQIGYKDLTISWIESRFIRWGLPSKVAEQINVSQYV